MTLKVSMGSVVSSNVVHLGQSLGQILGLDWLWMKKLGAVKVVFW